MHMMCVTIGGLPAYASLFLLRFAFFEPGGSGAFPFGVWAQLLALVAAGLLLRSAEKLRERRRRYDGRTDDCPHLRMNRDVRPFLALA